MSSDGLSFGHASTEIECGHERDTSTESIRGSFFRSRASMASVSTEISGDPIGTVGRRDHIVR